MGTDCSCVNKQKHNIINPVIYVEHQEEIQQERKSQKLDLIYVPDEIPKRNLNLGVENFHSIEQLQSRRTSEPSLMILNKQITKILTTFENAHGTISNELTRSNTLKKNQNTQRKAKIRQLTNQISQIQYRKKKNAEDIIMINDSVKNENGTIIEEPENKVVQTIKTSERKIQSLKKIVQPGLESFVETDSETSSLNRYDEEEYGSQNILGESLINQQKQKKQHDLVQRYSVIEGNQLLQWDNYELTSFKLDFKEIPQVVQNVVYYAAIVSITSYYTKFGILLSSFKCIGNQKYLVKLWVNGFKRAISIETPQTNPYKIFENSIAKLYNSNQINTNPSYQIYHLGGWCPECLLLSEISNKQNLWQRLKQNFLEGNILITFAKDTQQFPQKYYTLITITQQNLLQVANLQCCLKDDTVHSETNLYHYTWNEICEFSNKIYINWNPSIYSFSKKFDNYWSSLPEQSAFQNETIFVGNNPQYLLKIPKHAEDFQIRIFVDRHVDKFNYLENISVKLYEYDGMRALNPQGAIRNLDISERQLISDVFIFQKSEDIDYFILTIVQGDNNFSTQNKEVYYSLLFLSFIEVEIFEIPNREILMTKDIKTQIQSENTGMGINSPNFLNNIHFSLSAPAQSDIQILVEGPDQSIFNIILLEDNQRKKDLAKLNFQTVLNENFTTEAFEKYGFLEKQIKGEHYILVIGNQKSIEGEVKITVNVVSKLLKRNRELEELYSNITLERLTFQPKIIKTFEIKWTIDSSGPRKRLKNTTTPIYHPISTFTDFLKNPTVNLKLQKGKYQFNVSCNQYKKQFEKNGGFIDEDLNDILEPPALSICLFKVSENGKGYKIMIDDAYYVPMGYGYWSQEILLEEGKYVAVCPRISKSNSRGTLKIRLI